MMNVNIKVYSDSKYDKDSTVVAERTYEGIKGYSVMTIEDEELYRYGYDEVDENREYLFITLKDDSIATFRNSHVDMFRA